VLNIAAELKRKRGDRYPSGKGKFYGGIQGKEFLKVEYSNIQ